MSCSSAASSARAEALDLARALEQPRVAHAQHVADHAGASGASGTTWSSSVRTLSIAASSTCEMPSIDTRLRAVAASRRMVDHHADRRVRQAEFARERGLGHAGHAHQRGAVAFEAVDLRRRLEPRAVHRAVDAAVRQRNAGRRGRRQAAFAQPRVVRMREIDVHDVAVAAVEERRFAPRRVVDELVRQHEVAGARSGGCRPTEATATHGPRPLFLQRPQVRAVVDPVRRNRVAVAVPGEEYRVALGDLAEQQRRRRVAVGRAHDFAVRHGQRR